MTEIPAPELREAHREFDRWATVAGPVRIEQCLWLHEPGLGCTGPLIEKPCGEAEHSNRVWVGNEPAYTARDLRRIQKVEWDQWFDRRRRQQEVTDVSPDR